MMNKIFLLASILLFLTAALATAQVHDLDTYDLEEALELAQSTDKKVLIDVYAEWCPYCERMHKNVYTDPEVAEAIEDYYYLVMINIESSDEVNYLGNEMSEREFSQQLNSESLPTTFFMNSSGELLGKQPGLLPADTFYNLLNFVGSDAYLSTTFEEYQQSR